MSCSDWQMKIAADLDDPALAEHLSGCSECRTFAADLAENAAALRAVEVNEASYAAVRARVLEAVRPKRRFAWVWACAAAVAACVVLVWWTAPLRAPAPGRPPSLARTLPPPPPQAAPHVERVKVHRAARRPVLLRAANREPLTSIKLLTDDPNVVIIWLVDKKGD